MKMKKQKNNQKGITLIALIVTIIVLLILAGISISMLTGQNGILNRASEAKEKTEVAGEEELRKLTQMQAAMNIEDTTHTDNSTGEQKTVTIPAGFAVSQVEGENTIDKGLVIIDSNGNEFVWVPVDDYDEFIRRDGYIEGNIQSLIDWGDVGEADGNSETGDNTNSEVKESETTKTEVKQMYKSIYDNGGFYIGRYETGKDSDKNVVIQKGVDVYNNVAWSKNKTINEESTLEGTENNPDGAIEIARDFDEANDYTTVTSTLCYGVQWDATLKWIDSTYTGFAKDSTGKGNYNEDENTNEWKGKATLTGSSENYKVNNIYDLAGNVYEWTMESSYTNYRVYRGGIYNRTGFERPVSIRFNSDPSSITPNIGFRITLYL